MSEQTNKAEKAQRTIRSAFRENGGAGARSCPARPQRSQTHRATMP